MLKKPVVLGIILLLLLSSTLPLVTSYSPTSNLTIYSDENDLDENNQFSQNDQEHWAIIIGPYEEPISIFEIHAEMIKYIFCDKGFKEDHVKLLKGKEATLENLTDAFSWVKDHEDSDDVVILWLNDHGSPGRFSLYHSSITYEELNTQVEGLDSKKIAIIIDACYSGSAIPFLSKEGRIIITGCGANQTSGLITNVCLCALQGYGDYLGDKDGLVSIEEMFNFVKTHESGLNGMSPQIDDRINGELETINIEKSDCDPDQFQNLFFGSSTAIDYGYRGLAQTFKPNTDKMYRLKLFLCRKGNPRSLKISIRENLSGNDIISFISSEEYITPYWIYAGISYDFYFPEIELIPGKTYYIVCENQECDNDNKYYWANTYGRNAEPFDGYERGSAYINEWGEWVKREFDFCFATFYDENLPPNLPIIQGPSKGTPGEEYTYTLISEDPEKQKVDFYIDWGDGTFTDWIGPYSSGEVASGSHIWELEGSYNLKIKCRDSYGDESDWATLEVSMPKNKEINTPFLNFLENYPYLFPLLRQLLNVY